MWYSVRETLQFWCVKYASEGWLEEGTCSVRLEMKIDDAYEKR